MAESRTPLPPFAALRAFHAAAVHARFRDAAAALGVTESAISHQVRRLEDFLRTSLFDRSGPGVRLTAAGRRYLEEIDPAIRQIQAATQAVLRPAGRDVARLTLPPSLAATWLIPRLGAFERAHPDVDLQLVPTTPPERAVADLYDDHAVEHLYYPEIEGLLRAATGASRVVVFDATRRSDAGAGAKNPDGLRGPASRVHVDYVVAFAERDDHVKGGHRRPGA